MGPDFPDHANTAMGVSDTAVTFYNFSIYWNAVVLVFETPPGFKEGAEQ